MFCKIFFRKIYSDLQSFDFGNCTTCDVCYSFQGIFRKLTNSNTVEKPQSILTTSKYQAESVKNYVFIGQIEDSATANDYTHTETWNLPHRDRIGTTSGPGRDRIGAASGPGRDRIGTASGPHRDRIGTTSGPDL